MNAILRLVVILLLLAAIAHFRAPATPTAPKLNLSSLTLDGQSVRAPLAPKLPPRSALNRITKRATVESPSLVGSPLPRAVLTLVPGGALTRTMPGTRPPHWFSDALLGGLLATSARVQHPSSSGAGLTIGPCG
jgi:hypothetical protein